MFFTERALRKLAVAKVEEVDALADRFLAPDGTIPPRIIRAVDRLTSKNHEVGTFAGVRIAVRSSLRRNFGVQPK